MTTCNECCIFNSKGKELMVDKCPKYYKDLAAFVKKNNIKECPYIKNTKENNNDR